MENRFNKKYLIVVGAAFILFFLSIKPVTTFDTFYNLRIGEMIAKTGQIPSREIFSWAAYGRHWIAYEWLGQTIEYTINRIGGFLALEIYVALAYVLFFSLFFLIYRYIFLRGTILSVFISIFLCAFTYDFFVPRPQLIGFLSFLTLLVLIFLYLLKDKNLLILSIPLSYIWANSHASFIFIPFFFFSYAILGYLYFLLIKENSIAQEKMKNLFLFGFINLGVTLLPPLGYKLYELIWQFLTDLSFFSTFVTEWNPLISEPIHFFLYLILLIIIVILTLLLSFKKRNFKALLLIIPLFAVSLMPFSAIRHFLFGLTSILLALGLVLRMNPVKIKSKFFFFSLNFIFITIVILFSAWSIAQDRETAFETNLRIPRESIKFLKENHLQGRMFNEVAMGGYFIYYLYPQYQVFFDGRADIYHCCEMRDFWKLVIAKESSREEFKKALYPFLEKYRFSFLVLSVTSYNPLSFTSSLLIADTLLDDPNWRLIYFSDNIQILLKNDGKNSKFYNELGMLAATPYRISTYRKNQEETALKEYQRMIKIQDSGVARTALGEIYLNRGDLVSAEKEFEVATRLNPNLGKSYLDFAKVALEKNQLTEAQTHLQKALEISPFLGETYLLLAQTYSQLQRNDLALAILKKGLQQNIDLISRQKIAIMIQDLGTR